MKRVGSYIDPTTGEEHWLELDTLGKLIVDPVTVSEKGRGMVHSIILTFDYDKDSEMVNMRGSIEDGRTRYVSNDVQIEPLTLSDALFKKSCYSISFLANKEFSPYVNEVIANLSQRIFEESRGSRIIGRIEMSGGGFVSYKGEDVIAISSVVMEVDQGELKLKADNCVGHVQMGQLPLPLNLSYYYNEVLFQFSITNIISATGGSQPSYECNIDLLETSASFEPLISEDVLSIHPDDDNYVSSRIAILSSEDSEEESAIDDRFAGLF